MKLRSGSRRSFAESIRCSSHSTWPGTIRSAMSVGSKSSPGVARSAPRSNKSFCTRARSVASSSASIVQPSTELASSTAPTASKRGSCLARREPSTSPVVPSSPVRVYILLSRTNPLLPALVVDHQQHGNHDDRDRLVLDPREHHLVLPELHFLDPF